MTTEKIELRVDEDFLMQIGKVRDEYQDSPMFFNGIQNQIFETAKAEKLHYNWTNEVTVQQNKKDALNFYLESINVMSETKFGYDVLFKNVLSNVLYGLVISDRPNIVDNIKDNLTLEQKEVVEKVVDLTPVIDKDALINELIDCMLTSIRDDTVRIKSETAINSYFRPSSDKNQTMFDHPDINAEDIDYYSVNSRNFIPKEDAIVLGSIIYDCKVKKRDKRDDKNIIKNPKYLSSNEKLNETLKKPYKFY